MKNLNNIQPTEHAPKQKKVWKTPAFVILDTNDVQAGAYTGGAEGAKTGFNTPGQPANAGHFYHS